MTLSAKEVLNLATAAAKGADSGQIEGEFTFEVEIEETKLGLSANLAGPFVHPTARTCR